jgi:hypothetical protein
MAQGNRPGFGLVVALLAIASTLAGATMALAADGHAGKWRGEISMPQGKLVVLLELTQDDAGTWKGTIGSSVDKGRMLQVEDLKIAEDRVDFGLTLPGLDPAAKQHYEGRFEGDRIKGVLTVKAKGRPTTFNLNFRRLTLTEEAALTPPPGSPISAYDVSNPLSGSWAARSSEEDETRLLKLELGRDNSSKVSGTITDTGTNQTTVLRDIGFEDNTVAFNFRPEGAPFLASFWGRYIPEDDEIKGSLSLGGRSQPLTFERVGRAPGATADYYAPPPRPRKHFSHLGASARLAYWNPLHVLRKDVRNINDITTSSTGFDLGARFYVMDSFGVQLRYFRGGLGFDTNETNLALFNPNDPNAQGVGIFPTITADSYLGLSGFEMTLMGYVGPLLCSTSHFNPYVIGVAGKTSWALGSDSRDGTPVAIYAKPLEGDSWEFGAGLGTEYEINGHLGIEAEWLWSYFLTEDVLKWADNTEQWTNTHAYRISLGAVYWF